MIQETVAFVEDIYCAAKIREVARQMVKDVRFVRDSAGMEKRLTGPPPAQVFIELTAEGLRPMDLIRQIKAQGNWGAARIVAYSSHSRAELLEEANQLGADLVLSKQEFTQRLPEILQGSAV